jgi:flagellar hook-associated protein 2
MATSSVTSTSSAASPAAASTSTSAQIAAANRTAAQKLMSSLSAGSGVDVSSLAQNLVDAERVPRENEINSKISKNGARVSGYSAITFMFSELKNAFSALKDRNSFNTLSANNSNTSAFNVTAGPLATTGTHDVEVTRLARAQRTVSNGLASATTPLNGRAAMTLSLSINPSSITPTVATTQGVSAVTESSAVAFQALGAGEWITVGGLKLTANVPMTASAVAAAFANVADGATPSNDLNGDFQFDGALSGFSSGSDSSGNVTFTSSNPGANVSDLTVSALNANTLPTQAVTQGVSAVTERSVVTFKDMAIGQTVTVGGLTLTATAAMTAAQVASAFANAASGSTPSNPTGGTFSGTLTGFATDTSSNGSVTFTTISAGTNVADLSVGAATKQISLAAGKDTPQDIVAAINASGTSVKAQLVNTGDGSATPFQIVLTGATGLSNAFTLSANYGAGSGSPGLVFATNNPANQTATDALLKVDGITYTRSTNSISDAVQGLTFDLKTTTSSAANLTLTRDTTPIKDKLKTLVTAYKDANDILTEVSNPDSTLDTYGKTLVGDSTVRSLKTQLRAMFTGSSSTPGTTVGSLWQMGFKIDEKGNMSLDEAKLDTVLADNYDDVVKSFTGGYNNLGTFSTLAAGYAGDAFKKLDKITGSTGVLVTNTDTANKQNEKYKKDLETLKTRMDALLQRYTKQFSSMDSLVGQINSQKTSLKSTFDGMMAMYSNK